MALFRDIDHFCEHYPALHSVSWERLLPSIELVEERTLRNVVLGPTLYDALHASFQASIAPTSTPMSVVLAALHAKCMRAVAFLSVYEAIPDLSALFTSAGLRQNVGEGETPAPMWLSNQSRDSALAKGHTWLDSLIGFLFSHKADYPSWTSSPMYAEVSESLITTMTTMYRHTRIIGSAWLLHMLRPAMRNFQTGALTDLIGSTRMDQLVGRVNGTGTLDAADLRLLDLARPAILYAALADEAVSLRIHVDRTGVYTLEGSTASSQVSRAAKSATADQLTALVRSCRAKSDDFVERIRAIVQPNEPLNPGLGATGSVFRS